MCMPIHEARKITHGRNQDMMINFKQEKLVGAVHRMLRMGPVPPSEPNPRNWDPPPKQKSRLSSP